MFIKKEFQQEHEVEEQKALTRCDSNVAYVRSVTTSLSSNVRVDLSYHRFRTCERCGVKHIDKIVELGSNCYLIDWKRRLLKVWADQLSK